VSLRFYPRYVWEYVVPRQAVILFEIPHEGATDDEIVEKVVIPRDDYEDLKVWMRDNDPFGQFLTDRKEDLKIIHKLLDIQEKLVK